MQNRYTADIGDFSKCALLNALTGNGFRLGVMWYLNLTEESNADGRFTKYAEIELCDPVLCKKLSAILQTSERNVSVLETNEILPYGTLFYREPLPFPVRPCLSEVSRTQQTKSRAMWFLNGYQKLRNIDLVFLDPDNGMAGKRVRKFSRKSVKYAFPDEITSWLNRKQSVVVYQHQKRQTLETQIWGQLNDLGKDGWALSFHRQSTRIYYVLPATAEHRRVLWQRSTAFLATRWGLGGHFRIAQR